MNKKNMKIYITFGILMIASLFGGYLAGRGAGSIQDKLDAIDWHAVSLNLYMPAAGIFIAAMVILYGISICLYVKASKHYTEILKLDDEIFENEIPAVEERLNKSLIISSIMFILGTFLFALVLLCYENASTVNENITQAGAMIAIVCMLVGLALFMTVNALVVNLEKKINPEKRGNIFDLHFRKKWIGSMDEAELMKAARGGLRAYTAGLITGIVMWVISLICMLSLHTGILPIICTTVIMLVMVIAEGSEN